LQEQDRIADDRITAAGQSQRIDAVDVLMLSEAPDRLKPALLTIRRLRAGPLTST